MVRSLIFWFFWCIWTLAIGLICVPSLMIPGYRASSYVSLIWAKVTLYALWVICNLKIQMIGVENLQDGPYIVASKHQSTLETILFRAMFRAPAYIVKQELYYIPIFGAFLWKNGMIAINRKDGIRSLKKIVTQAREALSQARQVIIFPEGTRTEYGDKVASKYKNGVFAIYETNYDVIPVALNTGKFWPKSGLIIHSGVAIVKFLPKITQGKNKEAFTQILYDSIEGESLKMATNS